MDTPQGGRSLIDAYKLFNEIGVQEKMIVADLGCGNTGHFTFPLAKTVGEDGIVYAVDVIKHVLEGIESRNKIEGLENVKTVWSNLETSKATDIKPNSLDMGFLINTLHQSKKQYEMMQESVRLIKSGGKLVIVDWESHTVPLRPSMTERISKKDLKN